VTKNTSKKPYVFIGGMCSLPLGVMERQLGNMAIFIPLLKKLQSALPDYEILTSLQLSKEFCQDNHFQSLNIPSIYSPTIWAGITSVIDWLRSLLFRIIKKLTGHKPTALISNDKLKAWYDAEIYLDFSGDTYGDIAHWGHFLKHSFDILTLRNLDVPIIFYAQSTGPFSSSIKRTIGKLVLNQVNLVTARETEAFKNLSELKLSIPVIQTACPAWSLKPAGDEKINRISTIEGLSHFESPLIGLNITGYNFASELISKDKYQEERDPTEFLPIIEVMKHILEDLNANLILIPHVYRLNENNQLIPGPDGKISEQLYQLVSTSTIRNKERMMIVKGTYTSDEVKGLIGKLDLFISGRVHAGVAGMSQAVPTIMLAYSPKHYGFAAYAGLKKLVMNNYRGKFNPAELNSNIDFAWENKSAIQGSIKDRLQHIEDLVDLNHQIVSDILAQPKNLRNHIPKDLVRKWTDLSAQALRNLP
jgi:colanic acid/amylovoran biosynthesis protein